MNENKQAKPASICASDLQLLVSICDAINSGAIGFVRAIEPAVYAAIRAFNNLGAAYYKIAEGEYKRNYGKFPGSIKTKRLRKKRRVKILNGFAVLFQ